MNSTMSILGLYNYDNTLFANLSVPSDFDSTDKQLLVDNLVTELAELEVVYPTPVFMKSAIGFWSAKELPTWEKIYAAAQAEYNPIENYDRQESSTDVTDGTKQHSGTDSVTNSGTDTLTNSGSDTSTQSGTDTVNNTGTDTTTNQISSYDTANLQTHDTSSLLHGHSQATIYGHVDTFAHGHVESVLHGLSQATLHGEKIDDDITQTHTSRIHGNIGVTTSQQMLEQELAVAPKLNVMNYIIESFKNRFCIMVW